MKNSFHSHGKLLITGEYLVLKGATAFAIPLNVGQKTKIEHGIQNDEIHWKSYYGTKCWFEAKFKISNFEIIQTEDFDRAGYIQKLLGTIKQLNPLFFSELKSVKITNNLGFHPDWGLGSSSTLISNLASFAHVDPFEVNKKMSGGSGFDIACATSKKPVLYQTNGEERLIKEVTFAPSFADGMYLIWLGNKKSTNQSIDWFDKNIDVPLKSMNEISAISGKIHQVNSLGLFSELLERHNSIMENVLGVASVQKQYFSNFNGTIKALGAWGGDFILAVSSGERNYVTNYFKNKGLEILFNYNDLIISNGN